ncbi:MAG: phosphoheptose isomerase [Candidatus Accumulibacter sp.]|jgi:D-sedoheptulose 7-phosphate isomerase|nr:phosphoheptose isomerase [Accumulibacter sp.]
MDLISRIGRHFRDSAQTKLDAVDALAAPIARAAECFAASLAGQGKILSCGNGGSAADAQHFAAELVGRFERERPGLAAVALTTDTSILTAVANDYSYDKVFARQVSAIGRAGDVLLAISTSGNSPSVIEAIRAAHESAMRVVALTGRGGGKLGGVLADSDVHLCVPSERTPRIQEVHLLCIHCLCDAIDALLPGVSDE